MPLFDYRCEDHGTFEAFKRRGATSAPCPTCGAEAGRVFVAAPVSKRAYDQSIDGKFPNKNKPKVMERMGGGRAAQVKETGGYRPMLTHNTVCPKEGKWRNVAVLAAFPYGKHLCCEACAYTWVYSQSNGYDVPLNHGVREDLRPSRTIHMNPDVPLHSGYTQPERGA